MDFPEYIDRLEAVSLIAVRTCPARETIRSWKNKINGQINYRKGKREIAADNQGLLLFVDVIRYAKKKFPSKFDDWPNQAVIIELVGISAQCQSSFATATVLPNDLAECHQAISDLTIENHKLRQEIAEKQAEIELLKPDAEWRRAFKRKSGRCGK